MLENFIDFILSEEFSHDVAFGHRTIKTENGNIIMPNIIRCASHKRIIDSYYAVCKEEGIPSLSQSYCYKVLKKCGASFKKSFQGLDNIKADGLNSFDKLFDIFESQNGCELDLVENDRLTNIVTRTLDYLKYTYIKNLKMSSSCADHCVSYALSKSIDIKSTRDHENNHNVECDHTHLRDYDDCNLLEIMFKNIYEKIELIRDETHRKNLT